MNKVIKYDNCSQTKDTKDIADAIEAVFEKLRKEGQSNPEAVQMITQWFDYNQDLGKEYFKSLYPKRQKLFVDAIEDIDSLYSIMRSRTPLREVNELIIDIERDPQLKALIDARRQEIIDVRNNTIIGENVEEIVKELLIDYKVETKSAWIGRDLILSIRLEGGKNISYDIEVKSTSSLSYVGMTPRQARTAVYENPKYYSLCVVYRDGSEITKDYVKNNAKFKCNISELLLGKVEKMEDVIKMKNELIDRNDNVDLKIINDLDYRYGISNQIWRNGMSFNEFIVYLSELNS